ncbi:CubicO group peptidase (beta-lactamase class C family) [Luteimonas cucumeris]|uniref:CubicO group peptidase (Beta-lactamase class C family) n=1 Tax=Luteimonas cucumeris TaxID=985012 RepID=A0A562LEH4_9GAMM|nr:serine hydrolase [Luteimonas cucumeris]TWI06018.1 CubicO group peptidase (beta-lactamase class C family) [Luteimonas cucumeris]
MKVRLWLGGMALWLACLPMAAGAADAEVDAAVASLLEGAKASRSSAMLVMRDGEVLAEYYRGGKPPAPIEMMSATKSIVALAIGALIGDGRIASLDAPVHTWYPEWKQGRKRDITLRMLMDHTSGLQNVMRADAEIYPAPDFVKLALAAELDAEPGKVFAYNNKAMNLLAGIVAKASGSPMDEYLQRRLFAPMGIQPGKWERDPAGNPHAMSGLPLRAADAAKLGQLVMEGGRWNGQPLLPAAFVREMLAPSKQAEEYGLLWWRSPAWARYGADERSFKTLRDAGVPADVIARLQALSGKRFADRSALIEAITGALGANAMDTWGREVASKGLGLGKVFNIEIGPYVAYNANGYLGQYIVIVPQAKLVAVRQVESSEDYRDSDGYDDFIQRTLALADALVDGELKPLP